MHAMMHWIGSTRWFILHQLSFLIHTSNFNSDMTDLKLLLEAADDGNPDIYQYFQIYFLLILDILLSILHDMFNIPHFPLPFLNIIVCSLNFPNLSISVKQSEENSEYCFKSSHIVLNILKKTRSPVSWVESDWYLSEL